VGARTFRSPITQTFFDFQIHYLLLRLGREWYDHEIAKAPADRHVVLRWRDERNETLRAYQAKQGTKGPVQAPFTGGSRALQVLADDLYQVAHASDVPRRLIERLRDIREFQGARHELCVAGLFAKCGFELKFSKDTSRRLPEFIAQRGSEKIGVEAKSRRRPGVLHERGEYQAAGPAEIRRLYESAAGQNPGDCAFLVFIDVNLPLTPEVQPDKRPWVIEAMDAFRDRELEGLKNRDTGIFMTNFGWYFSREEGTPAGESHYALALDPKYPVQADSFSLLDRALREYGTVTDED
jgi:hypothetical protein